MANRNGPLDGLETPDTGQGGGHAGASGAGSGGGPLLGVETLSARRGYRVLFEGLDFELPRGGAVELRGPNGSGKSTLLRILAGLTRPHMGIVRIYPDDAASEETDRARHYLGHLDAVKPAETALAQARFWSRFLTGDVSAAEAALERVGLSRRADVPGRGLSAGQKRRLALARLVLDPRPIWLLDEPMASLDVDGQALVRELVAAHLDRGGGVVAAVHGEGFAGATPLDLRDYPASPVAADMYS
ncbi:MAG: heme ABC exporter ATP-binding protein CcmA [Hyphomonadaceae bacterium]